MNLSAYRVGYVITLSFMLIASMFTFTLGYYPPPEGPKRPEYPTYSPGPIPLMQSLQQIPYQYPQQGDYDKYQRELKQYEADQKNFIKDKIIPYTKRVLVGWILVIVLLEVIGLILTNAGQSFVGGAYAFSGVWAVIFGPIGSLVWFLSAIVSSFAGRANQDYSADPVLKAVSVALIFGSVVLTVFGLILIGNLRLRFPQIFRTSSPSPSPEPPLF